MTLTPESLARLQGQIAEHVRVPELPASAGRDEDRIGTRSATLGIGILSFRGQENTRSTPGPRVSASLLSSRPIGENARLILEPSLGGRGLHTDSRLFTEVVGELRESLAGIVLGRRSQLEVNAWQKGRFLSRALPEPGYLEPGRVEGGLAGRVTLPIRIPWEVMAEGGVEGVRYESGDWEVLDREGVNGALRLARSGVTRAVRLSLMASHHRFPNPAIPGTEAREDTRLGVEVDGAMETRWVLRFSLGGSWNQSRLPAYDFRSGRAALVLSAPLAKGSLQGYMALAHQEYRNPGPGEARVAPSDQDSGAILSLQYGHPLDATHMLFVRGGWSRSQTGFRNDFYERFALSLQLTFRDWQGFGN